jgi:hypothetical protein
MGAPLGNTNGAKSRAFYGALSRAIAQDDGERLRRAAEKLLDLAAEGEAWAVKELRDTMDGKPAQAVEVGGVDGGPVQHSMRVLFASE